MLACDSDSPALALVSPALPSSVSPADADLSIDQTAWGDSGVYYCTVTSSQDLQGNNEAYAELIVLGKWPGLGHKQVGSGMFYRGLGGCCRRWDARLDGARGSDRGSC